MIDELNKSIQVYWDKWLKVTAATNNKNFFASQRPTAVAWKTTDLQELLDYFNELRDSCDQIHWGWVNERWLVTMHLKDTALEQGITIIKLMQRRPGSTDAVGLDHLDFLGPKNNETEKVLAAEKLSWTPEQNNQHCSWISVWFANTEAKLRTDTVLDPCIAEMEEANRTLKQAAQQ